MKFTIFTIPGSLNLPPSISQPATAKSFVFLLIWLLLVSSSASADSLRPVALCAEYLTNPHGIDETYPRLTWRVESDERGQCQTAYRLLVASSLKNLAAKNGDLWDTGKVSGHETVNIAYRGKPLVSRQQCFWKVCVWDEHGQTRWSEPASWTMGLNSVRFISGTENHPVAQVAELV
jgi:alpha-L-rhamnosidase